MKAIFFSLFFLLFFLGLSARSEPMFIVERGDFGLYVWHLSQPGETILQLARDYHVRTSLLLKVNDWGVNSRLKSGEQVRIPLIETNFFKLAALNTGSGYSPVYHKLGAGESVNDVRQRYHLSLAAFQSWNGTEAQLAGKQALIVGWLKYKPHTKAEEGNRDKESQASQKNMADILPSKEQAPPGKESARGSRFLKESRRAPKPHSTDTTEAVRAQGSWSMLVQTLKRAGKAIGEDTRDAWQKLTGKTPRKDTTGQPPPAFVSVDTVSNMIEAPPTQAAAVPALKISGPASKGREVKAAEPQFLPENSSRTAEPHRVPWFSRFKKKVKNIFSPPQDKESTPVSVQEPAPAPVPRDNENTLTATAPAEKPEPRNEMKGMNFSQTRSGKAGYFFGGPSGGKFYAATNLAPRGAVIRVTNPVNGKSVICEVLAPLSTADAAKGLLLKMSDNARLPLGQRSNQFSVRVNY